MQITRISQNQKTSFNANVLVKTSTIIEPDKLPEITKYAKDTLQLKNLSDKGIWLKDASGYLLLDLRTKTGKAINKLEEELLEPSLKDDYEIVTRSKILYAKVDKVLKDKRCKIKTIAYTPPARKDCYLGRRVNFLHSF